jgi:hypothetical protein
LLTLRQGYQAEFALSLYLWSCYRQSDRDHNLESLRLREKALKEAHPEFWESWAESRVSWYLIQF